MINSVSSPSSHFFILRPYAFSSEASLANDRYYNVANALLQIGCRVTLVAQSFSHSRLLSRSSSELEAISSQYQFVRFVSVPSYRKSVGLGRLAAEFIYAVKAFVLLVSQRPSRVLVGEPQFFTGWLALLYGFLFRKIICCDLIDAWPEALAIPKIRPLALARPFNIILFPLVLSRSLRLLLYNKLFTVSTSYVSLVPHFARCSVKVFYWCSQAFFSMVPLKPDEETVSKSNLDSPFVVSYIGSLGSGYDISTIIDAAAILDCRFPGDFIFKIAGGGHKSCLLEQSQVKNVFFLGYLSSLEMCAELSSSSLMLLPYAPNTAVAMPIKFFDAVNLRMPVVSSLELEAGELIEKYKIGVAYQAQNPESLVSAILRIRLDYEVYRRNAISFSDSFSTVFDCSLSYSRFAFDLLC
jgi:hypothetical protein